MLEINTLIKTFGANLVLDIPMLRLERGIYWLQGANGSGKSTLMKILAGLLPFQGEILLDNGISPVHNPIAYRLKVNHAPAEPLYPSFLSGDELISFSAHIKRAASGQVAEFKALLQMGNYTTNPVGSYSSGMMKKLSLLLAFLGNPSWILLDEPFTTLDLEAQATLRKLIAEGQMKDISFIITSHHHLNEYEIQFTKCFRIEQTRLIEVDPIL